MTGPRRLVVALVLVALAWAAVIAFDRDDPPGERPEQLTDVAFTDLERIIVTDPASSSTSELRPDGDRLVVADGAELDPDLLEALRRDLFPMLAIRSLGETRPEFGLAEPRLVVELVGRSTTEIIEVGVANFDDTGVYASVDGNLAVVLTSVVDALAATIAPAEGQPAP